MELKKITFERAWVAQRVLNDMKKVLDESSSVSAADYYDLSNVCVEYQDHLWGWKDLSDASVQEEVPGSYTICLPAPVKFDNDLPDMVNHPPHYKSKSGMEAIDVIESFTADLKGGEATNTGNVLKYMLRWKSKNGLQDLEKARWYLNRLINLVENNKMESEQ